MANVQSDAHRSKERQKDTRVSANTAHATYNEFGKSASGRSQKNDNDIKRSVAPKRPPTCASPWTVNRALPCAENVLVMMSTSGLFSRESKTPVHC